MSVIVAMLDTSAAARPVLETAIRVGQMTGSTVEATCVAHPSQSTETPELLASRYAVPFRVRRGRVLPALLDAVGAPEVVAAVVGARSTPGGRRPVGTTARRLVESSDKPVVVVPPEAVSPPVFRRLLIPLEGTDTTSRAVIERLRPLIADEIEVVVLHVFTEATLPPMLDRPEYDLEILGQEFLLRHFPHATSIELRPGPVARRVGEVSAEERSDLIVLSWSQDSSGDRAKVIREVLAGSPIPILLLPATPPDMGPVDCSDDGGVPAERV
jgi:nucleotide-binding universal stress UspA family protein